ncbi:16S rRNA (uracil(1498)-N(3))-methyltransferase [Mucilaginibacter koreensis]
MQLFYTPDIIPDAVFYQLNEEESKHGVRVLRLQTGDELQLIDGKGNLYHAIITDAHPKRTQLRILSVQAEFQKRNHHLHIAVAPTKNIERLEWFLEKATEMGVDEVSLIITQRSERREAKTDRLNKIITSAVKQSVKAYHPQLNEPVAFSKFITKPFESQKFIAHCLPGEEKCTLQQLAQLHGRYLILIGPEGDFNEQEIDQALQAGYQPITLGESRLRTETAALAACFEINLLNR